MLTTLERPTSETGFLVDGLRWDLALAGVALAEGLDISRAEAILVDLGTLMAQDHGQIRYDVNATREAAGLSSSKSANALNPHTEASYYPQPPKLIALWCARAARCGGGQTLVADGFRMLSRLGNDERETAMREEIAFTDASRPVACYAPVFTVSPSALLRFSFNLLRHNCYDPETARIVNLAPPENNRQRLAERFLTLFDELHEAILIPDGGLLILDNRRMVHGRTSFTDQDRQLIRYWLC